MPKLSVFPEFCLVFNLCKVGLRHYEWVNASLMRCHAHEHVFLRLIHTVCFEESIEDRSQSLNFIDRAFLFGYIICRCFLLVVVSANAELLLCYSML